MLIVCLRAGSGSIKKKGVLVVKCFFVFFVNYLKKKKTFGIASIARTTGDVPIRQATLEETSAGGKLTIAPSAWKSPMKAKRFTVYATESFTGLMNHAFFFFFLAAQSSLSHGANALKGAMLLEKKALFINPVRCHFMGHQIKRH